MQNTIKFYNCHVWFIFSCYKGWRCKKQRDIMSDPFTNKVYLYRPLKYTLIRKRLFNGSFLYFSPNDRLRNARSETRAKIHILSILEDKLNRSRQYALATKKASHIPGCVSKNVTSRVRDVILPLCFALVKLHL